MQSTSHDPRDDLSSRDPTILSDKQKRESHVRMILSGEQKNSMETARKSALYFGEIIENSKTNPFKKPLESNILLMRDKERLRKKKEREVLSQMKFARKTTRACVYRSVPKMATVFSQSEEDIISCLYDEDEENNFILQLTRTRYKEKESLHDFIQKKREMFLLQYSIDVKKTEMKKLEKMVMMEEKNVEAAEQNLEADALMFDEFLKENDKSASDAIKQAEHEMKLRLEKETELKALNSQILIIKGEISKYEDQLKEYKIYQHFLESLSPPEWTKDVDKKRLEIKQNKHENELKEQALNAIDENRKSHVDMYQMSNPNNDKIEKDEESEDDDEVPELYFKDPQQLLDIFAELEEQNLSLIQNAQETEEALEEMRQTFLYTKQNMEKDIKNLKDEIQRFSNSTAAEEEEVKNLEAKSKLLSIVDHKAENQSNLLLDLGKRVEEVYKNCIADGDSNLITLQMLTAIENKLEFMFEDISKISKEKVEAAIKIKEKQRRLKQKKEMMELQRLHQEERIRKAMERTKTDTKKKVGRKLMMRSEPPKIIKTNVTESKMETKGEEELAYYFLP